MKKLKGISRRSPFCYHTYHSTRFSEIPTWQHPFHRQCITSQPFFKILSLHFMKQRDQKCRQPEHQSMTKRYRSAIHIHFCAFLAPSSLFTHRACTAKASLAVNLDPKSATLQFTLLSTIFCVGSMGLSHTVHGFTPAGNLPRFNNSYNKANPNASLPTSDVNNHHGSTIVNARH